MHLSHYTRLALAIAAIPLFCFQASSAVITDSYSESLKYDSGTETYDVVSSGSLSINITVSLSGVALSNLDASTPVSLIAGGIDVMQNLDFGSTLGDATNYSKEPRSWPHSKGRMAPLRSVGLQLL